MAAPSVRHIEVLLPATAAVVIVIPVVNQAAYVPTGGSFPGDYPGRD